MRIVQVSLPILPISFYPIDTSTPSVGISKAYGGEEVHDHGDEPVVQTQQSSPATPATPESNSRLRNWDAALAQWELHGSGQRGKAHANRAAKVECLDEVLGLLGTSRGRHV